jgi:hypothetical protein
MLVGQLIAPLLAMAETAAPQSDRRSCRPAAPGEIVVCAQRQGESPYRLPKLPTKYDRKAIRAEADLIPGVHSDAHLESAGRPDGTVAKRMMVTFKLPF